MIGKLNPDHDGTKAHFALEGFHQILKNNAYLGETVQIQVCYLVCHWLPHQVWFEAKRALLCTGYY